MSNHLKLIFAIPDLGSGGAERVVSILTYHLIQKGYDVEILLMFGSEIKYRIHNNVKITNLNLFDFPKNKRIGILRSYLKEQKDSHNNIIVFSFQVTCLKYLLVSKIGLGIKIVSSERNNPYRNGISFWRKMANSIPYILSDFCVFQTPDARKYYNLIRHSKCKVIPNPIVESSYKWQGNNSPGNLIMVCRLAHQKNIPFALRVIDNLKPQFPNIHLNIYGEGPLKATLQQTIVEMNLRSNVTLRGLTNNVQEKMSQSSIFLSTSDYEGISNSMLEAMSVGLPIISTDCPIGGAHMMLSKGAGVLVPVGEELTFTNQLRNLLMDTRMANRLSINAIQESKHYSPQSIANNWSDIILNLKISK